MAYQNNPLLIAADIGNSTISIGYFISKGIIVQNIPTHPILTEKEYIGLINEFIKENNMEMTGYAGIISSVVSSHTGVIRKALEGLCEGHEAEILVVNHEISGIELSIKEPKRLGTDRIADAVAAFSICRKPAAVINFGTATTITVVDGRGSYIGGAIIAGMGLMNQALGGRTSGLRSIDIRAPRSALGKDTEACIASGLFFGTAGAVERIMTEIERETMLDLDMILTGGFCSLIAPFIQRPHRTLPYLTLEGLKIIYDKYRPE